MTAPVQKVIEIPQQLLDLSCWPRGGRGNVLAVGNCCYVAVAYCGNGCWVSDPMRPGHTL